MNKKTSKTIFLNNFLWKIFDRKSFPQKELSLISVRRKTSLVRKHVLKNSFYLKNLLSQNYLFEKYLEKIKKFSCKSVFEEIVFIINGI